MFALYDALDHSFPKLPYSEREEKIADQSNFVNDENWPTNGRKTSESRVSFQRLKPGTFYRNTEQEIGLVILNMYIIYLLLLLKLLSASSSQSSLLPSAWSNFHINGLNSSIFSGFAMFRSNSLCIRRLIQLRSEPW